jgi:hypothetical protein
VFVLLLHFYLEDDLRMSVTMESPIKDRAMVNIGKTVDKHREIIPETYQLMHCPDVTLLPSVSASERVQF